MAKVCECNESYCMECSQRIEAERRITALEERVQTLIDQVNNLQERIDNISRANSLY